LASEAKNGDAEEPPESAAPLPSSSPARILRVTTPLPAPYDRSVQSRGWSTTFVPASRFFGAVDDTFCGASSQRIARAMAGGASCALGSISMDGTAGLDELGSWNPRRESAVTRHPFGKSGRDSEWRATRDVHRPVKPSPPRDSTVRLPRTRGETPVDRHVRRVRFGWW
jgi:hypothetical protein